jgi:hypothetical protein
MQQLSKEESKRILKLSEAGGGFNELISLQQNDNIARLKKKNKLARPIQNMIELIGGLIDTWWIVVSLASVGLAVTIGAAAVFGVLGIAYAAYSYKERQKDKTLIESYQLSLFKLEAAKTLSPDYDVTNREPKPYQASKTSLFGVVFGMSTLIFFSYFYGVSSIITSLGYLAAATAMTGPIGIAVAAVIGLGLGIYFGYRYYHDKKCKHGVTADKELVDAQVLEILASDKVGSPQIMRQGLGGSILEAPYLDPVKDLSTNRGAGRGSIEEQVDSEQAGTYNPQHSQTNQQRS